MMSTYTGAHKSMPKTPDAAKRGVVNILHSLTLLPAGSAYNVSHQATGRHLERVIVSLPRGKFADSGQWYDELVKTLPWSCRVTLVGEVGRIEIEPRGH